MFTEHPDITAAQSAGWAPFQSNQNQDGEENRWAFLEEHQLEFLKWIRDGYPELVEEFIQYGFHYHKCDYQQWLN